VTYKVKYVSKKELLCLFWDNLISFQTRILSPIVLLSIADDCIHLFG